MRRASGLLLLACAGLLAAPADASRGKANQLLRIISPAGRGRVAAHPFVNVIVRFGTGNTVADPATFRARLGGVNVTSLFDPILAGGAIVGMRAALGPALLNVDTHRGNRLRIDVRGTAGKGRRNRIRDVDRIRFRATDATDQAPIARALAGSEVILDRIPLQLDATKSEDPESDVLTYHWDFGDGATSTDPRPVHVFAATSVDVTVRLTVSDGQIDSTDTLTMLAVPPLDPGRTPGILKVEATSALEFGGVAVGSGATRSFTVRNTDSTPTSQLRVRLGRIGDAFALGAADLNLAADESASVDVAFTPSAPGHQSAEITLVGSAGNQVSLHMLSHGFGGVAPGTGPLPSGDTAFYNTVGGTFGIRPDGTRFRADNNVHTCQVPQNGPGTGDLCVTDADCGPNHGTCGQAAVCPRGDRAGLPCSAPADCPGSFCPASVTFDPIDMCGDGEGGLYLMSDEATFTDPSPPPDAELSGSILHLRFDAAGNRTGAEIVRHTTVSTTQMACDGVPAASGGQIYIAEYRAVSGPPDCFRDAKEALVARRKGTGAETVLVDRIDAAEGLAACDDYDPADDLQVTRDGAAVFVALPGGIYRIRPTTLLMTPDIDDVFQVHPDGSVLVVTATDQGPTGLLRLYKVSPGVAINGAPHLDELTPCATIEVPNNRGPG
ncbi:MAG TPA: PKD domain-containing protein, partial [Candidatus Binatus sp.]|nr:PKD domain-containing protein [Candidatus Binatus sp.]